MTCFGTFLFTDMRKNDDRRYELSDIKKGDWNSATTVEKTYHLRHLNECEPAL